MHTSKLVQKEPTTVTTKQENKEQSLGKGPYSVRSLCITVL